MMMNANLLCFLHDLDEVVSSQLLQVIVWPASVNKLRKQVRVGGHILKPNRHPGDSGYCIISIYIPNIGGLSRESIWLGQGSGVILDGGQELG